MRVPRKNKTAAKLASEKDPLQQLGGLSQKANNAFRSVIADGDVAPSVMRAMGSTRVGKKKVIELKEGGAEGLGGLSIPEDAMKGLASNLTKRTKALKELTGSVKDRGAAKKAAALAKQEWEHAQVILASPDSATASQLKNAKSMRHAAQKAYNDITDKFLGGTPKAMEYDPATYAPKGFGDPSHRRDTSEVEALGRPSRGGRNLIQDAFTVEYTSPTGETKVVSGGASRPLPFRLDPTIMDMDSKPRWDKPSNVKLVGEVVPSGKTRTKVHKGLSDLLKGHGLMGGSVESVHATAKQQQAMQKMYEAQTVARTTEREQKDLLPAYHALNRELLELEDQILDKEDGLELGDIYLRVMEELDTEDYNKISKHKDVKAYHKELASLNKQADKVRKEMAKVSKRSKKLRGSIDSMEAAAQQARAALGAEQVAVKLDDGRVVKVSAHLAVKEAAESAVDRYREAIRKQMIEHIDRDKLAAPSRSEYEAPKEALKKMDKDTAAREREKRKSERAHNKMVRDLVGGKITTKDVSTTDLKNLQVTLERGNYGKVPDNVLRNIKRTVASREKKRTAAEAKVPRKRRKMASRTFYHTKSGKKYYKTAAGNRVYVDLTPEDLGLAPKVKKTDKSVKGRSLGTTGALPDDRERVEERPKRKVSMKKSRELGKRSLQGHKKKTARKARKKGKQ